MHDLKWIRDNPTVFDEGLQKRGVVSFSAVVLNLDQRRRDLQRQLQDLQAQRNDISKRVGQAKREKSESEAEELMAQVTAIKDDMACLEQRERELSEELKALLATIPNHPKEEVPVGSNEDDNLCARVVGKPKEFGFRALEHYELGEKLGQMDFETAAKLSGSRFVVLKGDIARLHRAIGQFMIDLHVEEHGYQEVITPVMVRDRAMYGTGQLPKFVEDSYQTTDGHWLIPTSEVTMTNLVRDSIIPESDLPRRTTTLTQCFRSEAGSAGRDTRGMLRQHQFEKVEMVSIVRPEDSDAELERMTNCAEAVLKRLGLAYRVMLLCTGDMGFGACKTYDLEVWLPGQGCYREISSCSSCGNFQARRMGARFRREGSKKPEYLHTLNGSGLAVGRCLIAVMENYQQEEGSILVPEALRPYMGSRDVIN